VASDESSPRRNPNARFSKNSTVFPRALADEWKQLCEWFKSKATEVASDSENERDREIILFTVAVFCRDDPPQTVEGLTAFRSFAEHQVDCWQTTAPPDSHDLTVEASSDT
jgi:hypothetical protein